MDAGDLLEVLITSGVNIVLSGHKHVPYVWRLENMYIANAGTVSSLRLRGYTKPCYNVLEFEGDEVKIHRRFPFGGSNVIAHFSLATGAQYHRELEPPVQERAASGAASSGGRTPTRERVSTMRVIVAGRRRALPAGDPLGDRRRARARARGGGALLVGGIEKLRPDGPDRARRAGDPGARRPHDLARARRSRSTGPRRCSTCPTSRCSGYRERMELAAVALVARGPVPRARTSGSTRRSRGRRSPVPTLAVIGTGKRTGKTAIGGRARPAGRAAGPGPDRGRDGPRRAARARRWPRPGSVDLARLLELVRDRASTRRPTTSRTP